MSPSQEPKKENVLAISDTIKCLQDYPTVILQMKRYKNHK
jgi:hypothetical protein